jgi:hypothetical protein
MKLKFTKKYNKIKKKTLLKIISIY